MHNQVFVSDEQTNGLDDEAFNRMPPSPWCEKLNSTMTNHSKCRKYVDYQQVYATILNTNKVHLCTFQLLLIHSYSITSITSSCKHTREDGTMYVYA